jgi:hypothetical protein
MRRFVSIALVLLCWLAPACALLPGSDEAQLPACCRRHGAHHCMMAMASMPGPGQSVSTPAHCPLYHASSPARTGAFTLATDPPAEHTLESRMAVAAASLAVLHHARTSADRGPPAVL